MNNLLNWWAFVTEITICFSYQTLFNNGTILFYNILPENMRGSHLPSIISPLEDCRMDQAESLAASQVPTFYLN